MGGRVKQYDIGRRLIMWYSKLTLKSGIAAMVIVA